jgi:iron complex outermembrane receptor protein
VAAPVAAEGTASSPKPAPDLSALAIEDLMNLPVTTASKKAQRLSDVAAAVYVITQEDIRRSGATSLPEALRLAPGVHVAQIDGSKWAISIRGFTDLYADKLLVLIDGRSVYTPMFSGVYWDEQDLPLEEVERIEVIRGPGGTLWGANAVNGIINVITRNARDTQGDMVVVGGGSVEKAFTRFRHGERLRSGAYLSVYGKLFSQGTLADRSSGGVADDGEGRRAGLRMDWETPGADKWMVQGGLYHNSAGDTLTQTTLTPPYSRTFDSAGTVSGWHTLARWERSTPSGTQRSAQVYLDRSSRGEDSFHEGWSEADLDYQQRRPLGQRHDLIWGLGYRRTTNHSQNNFAVGFYPERRTTHLLSAFVHDEIALKENLRLSVGSKLQKRSRDPILDVQPSARLLWAPDAHHTYWAAVSRALRKPSGADTGLRIPLAARPGQNGLPIVLTLLGNDRVEDERLLAQEVGARFHPSERLSLDVTAFQNHYRDLIGAEAGRPFMSTDPAPHLVVPLLFANNLRADTRGLEFAGQWQATPHWRLAWGSALFTMDVHGTSASGQPVDTSRVENSPGHMLHLRSSADLSKHFQFDTLFYRVGRLKGDKIPGYSRLDVRLAWKPSEKLEFSLDVQNLLGHRYREFGQSDDAHTSPVERRIYGKLTWRR